MADNNTILEKLEGLVARFEEVSTLITDPAVIADQKRYVKLTKEYKELGDLMNARKEYMQVLGGIEEAKEIIANETDQEMREMAREELDACQARQPELEEQIKLAGHFLKDLNLPVAGPPRQDVLHQFHAHFKDKGHQGTQRSDDDSPDEDDLLVPQLDFFTQAQRHAQP